jgi:hypothetical protein
MSSPAKMQTVGEATSSIKGVFQSTFSSLASSLNLPQLRDSFFQNIIYILIVIIILVGILVYIQMVGVNSVNPLNLPPSKEIKKIQIQKVVEGFDMEQNGGLEDSSTNIDAVSGGAGEEGNMYDNSYNNLYRGQYENLYSNHDTILENLADLSSESHKKNKRNDY